MASKRAGNGKGKTTAGPSTRAARIAQDDNFIGGLLFVRYAHRSGCQFLWRALFVRGVRIVQDDNAPWQGLDRFMGLWWAADI
jgi:hypothetical protein